MPPSEDAQLLLRIVERHLRSLTFGLDEQFPAEDWGFTAQQAVEKLLTCWIVLADGEPPRSHELDLLASEANLELNELLLDLQPFAVEAAALRLQSFYTGVERMFLLVIRVVNRGTPSQGAGTGAYWNAWR